MLEFIKMYVDEIQDKANIKGKDRGGGSNVSTYIRHPSWQLNHEL